MNLIFTEIIDKIRHHQEFSSFPDIFHEHLHIQGHVPQVLL